MVLDTIPFFSKNAMKNDMNPSSPAWFAFTALMAFLGIGWWHGAWPVPLLVHVILGMGVFPLILAAMLYFTPVLTRSGPVSGWLHWLPGLALMAGGLAALAVWQSLFWVGVAVPLALLTVAGLFWWMTRRAAKALGAPHPGLLWYQAALLCLMLGLLAMGVAWVWPAFWSPLRMVHRHLNLLGFIGLAAIGTLQVLLPTVGRYPDPMAGQRLRFDLKYALLGTLCMAVGAVGWPWLSGLGVVAWGWVLGRLLRSIHGHVRPMVTAGGAELSLLLALLGFGLSLVSAPFQAGTVPLPLFFTCFLFPLVMGALAHLLPLWWWPGMPTPRRVEAQQSLGRHALLRMGSCWMGGAGMMVGIEWGAYLAVAPVCFFVGQALWLMRPLVEQK